MVPAVAVEAQLEVDAHVRTAKKRRRKELLASKWYCSYCKHYTERVVEGVPVLKCPRCVVGVEPCSHPLNRFLHERFSCVRIGAALIRVLLHCRIRRCCAYIEYREKRAKGRSLNRADAGAAGAVERLAAGILDDPTERERAVERETAALGAAIGETRSGTRL